MIPLNEATLVSQLSLIVARVARVEYPSRMGSLFDVLLGLLSSDNPFLIYQGMYFPPVSPHS